MAYGRVSLAEFAPQICGELPADTELSFRPVESPQNYCNLEFELKSRQPVGKTLIEHVWTEKVRLKLNDNFILYARLRADPEQGPIKEAGGKILLLSIRVSTASEVRGRSGRPDLHGWIMRSNQELPLPDKKLSKVRSSAGREAPFLSRLVDLIDRDGLALRASAQVQ